MLNHHLICSSKSRKPIVEFLLSCGLNFSKIILTSENLSIINLFILKVTSLLLLKVKNNQIICFLLSNDYDHIRK